MAARLALCAFVTVLSLGITPRASAETFGSATTSGNWTDSTTWVDASGVEGIPGTGDDVSIGAAGFPAAAAVTGTTITLSANATVASVNVGTRGTTSGNGTLDLAAGSLLSTATLVLDGSSGGSATLSFTGGSATVSGEFSLVGTGATLARTSGGFSTADLVLADGAALATTTNDSVTNAIQLSNGAVLTLGKNVALAGGLAVDDATLELEGFAVSAGGSFTLAGGGVVNRGAGGAGALAADGFTISGVTTFTAQVGDSFTGAGSVSGGATFTTDTPVSSLTSLSVSGANSALVGNALLTGNTGSTVTVSDGGRVTVNAGLSAGTLSVASGTLELNGGTLAAASWTAGLTDVAATVSRGGGMIDVGSGIVTGGTALTSLPGDAFDSLLVTDGTVTVMQASGDATGLWIRTASDAALSIDVLGGLALTFDTAAGGGTTDWILKWSGNRLEALASLIDDGYVSINRTGYQVAYYANEDATFVVIPEPWSLELALLGAAGIVFRCRSPRPRNASR